MYKKKSPNKTQILLQVSNSSESCLGELASLCDSTSGVCRYVSSHVDRICICAFSLCVGGRYAFVVCLVESVIKKTAVHQQRWIVPALVGDVSLLTCTCMSVSTHCSMYTL